MGQEWSCGPRVKSREVDNALISVFAFHCPASGRARAHGGGVGGRPRCCCHPLGGGGGGARSSEITPFKYFSSNCQASNYPAVTAKPVSPVPEGTNSWRWFLIPTITRTFLTHLHIFSPLPRNNGGSRPPPSSESRLCHFWASVFHLTWTSMAIDGTLS